MINFGKNLKYARENKELTQEAVMRLTGINRKSLSGYENNVAQPDLMTLATLAKLYDTSADHLLGIGSELSKQLPSPTECQILKKIKKLDKEHLAELNALLDVMIHYSSESQNDKNKS